MIANKNYIHLVLPFPPSVNHYYVKTRNGIFISKKGKQFRKDVAELIHEQIQIKEQLNYLLKVAVILFPPDARLRDLDNYKKALLDAITESGLWKDDKLINQLYSYRGEIKREIKGATEIIISEADPIIPFGMADIVINDLFGE